MSSDVLAMCNDYVLIDIPSCLDECEKEHKRFTQACSDLDKHWKQKYLLLLLSSSFISRKEYFIAYALLKHLISEHHDADTDIKGVDLLSHYHAALGDAIFKWHRIVYYEHLR